MQFRSMYATALLVTMFTLGAGSAFAAGGIESHNGVLTPTRKLQNFFLGGAPLGSGTFESSEVDGSFTGGVNVNTFVGADRFYAAGYTGTRARASILEGGLIWTGHETLTNAVQTFDSGTEPASNEVDRHATLSGFFLGGRPTAVGNEYQRGIAYNVTLLSQAIATSWSGIRYSGGFDTGTRSRSEVRQVMRAFTTGLTASSVTRPVDVVNTSFGSYGITAGEDFDSRLFDGAVCANPRVLHVSSAGNSGAAPIDAPASDYNCLAVGATGEPVDSPNLNFNTVSSYSNFGPNDFWLPSSSTGAIGTAITNVRATVDIVAPGTYIAGAYYGGTTGGNGNTLSGPPDGVAGTASTYSRYTAGTSFAAPTVGGGASLLYDAAYDRFSSNANARDVRVMKAVLMNSAEKTTGWNNAQATVTALPAGGGASQTFIRTKQSLDYRAGAGRMDLNRAFDQFLSGTTDVPGTGSGNLGAVQSLGWDYGTVIQGTPNLYTFTDQVQGGTPVRLTLSWLRDRSVTAATDGTIANNGFAELGEDNLDLQFWSLDTSGALASLVAESSSLYNNEEHLFFDVPNTGYYGIRVLWNGNLFSFAGDPDATSEQYGLAWSVTVVPEPASLSLVAIAAGVLGRRRNR